MSSPTTNIPGNNDLSTITNETNSNGVVKSTIAAEFNSIPDLAAWRRFYQQIRFKCEREATEKKFTTNESKKVQNRYLNRYRDVNPYDHSRIVLHRGSIDYINANLVKLERADRKYILTQGPLLKTVDHFWLMVWEQNSKAILMLNKIVEKKQVKCHIYWPDKIGPSHILRMDEVKLSVEFLRCEEYKNFIRRWFKLTDLESGESREIIQFHYTTWPDFGIPSSPIAFLQFLKQVRDSGALDHDVGPAVVHCSAGIGRSGTFCLVDCCLVLIDKEGEEKVSVQDILCELRRYRMGLIQTADQLFFSYQAIIEGIKLLKDSNFLEYNETPSICTEDNNMDLLNMDETPPPLPPRTHSLAVMDLDAAGIADEAELEMISAISEQCAIPGKPLPLIPARKAFNDANDVNDDDDDDDDNYLITNIDNNYTNIMQNNDTDELNNFIDNDVYNRDCISNRPLPPLPSFVRLNKQRTVIVLNDSDSEENDFFEEDDDDDNDVDDDDNDDVGNKGDNDGDAAKLNILTDVNNDNDDNANNRNNSFTNISTKLNDQQQQQETTNIVDQLNGNNETFDNIENIQNIANMKTNQNSMENDKNFCNVHFNANINSANTEKQRPNGDTNLDDANINPLGVGETQLKRRRRERQVHISKMVNEIKRKQREVEDNKKKSNIQRSFIKYVAAGVIMGVICVYAYTKFTSA